MIFFKKIANIVVLRYNNIEMTAKKWLIFAFSGITVIAIISGLLFFFFGNKAVKNDVVPSVYVQEIDGDCCLIADYNQNYSYNFKIEQEIDGVFSVVSEVKSKNNTLNLSKQNITLVPNAKFRFSACYATENSLGKFGKSEDWICNKLNPVLQVKCENNRLSWQKVDFAEGYNLTFVSQSGEVETLTTQNTDFSLEELTENVYSVYIQSYAKDLVSAIVELNLQPDGGQYRAI